MLNPLLAYISDYSGQSLTADEIALVNSTFRLKKLRKRQYFLEEGEVCHHYGFVLKGAMRQYAVCENGSENIVQLSIENWWVGDRESYVGSKASIYYIDAWEDSELAVISRPQTLELIEHSPAFSKMVRLMDDRNAIATQSRIAAYNVMTAEQRYHLFLKQYPRFVERFPLHMIASYIGITKETLSRIRKASHPGR